MQPFLSLASVLSNAARHLQEVIECHSVFQSVSMRHYTEHTVALPVALRVASESVHNVDEGGQYRPDMYGCVSATFISEANGFSFVISGCSHCCISLAQACLCRQPHNTVTIPQPPVHLRPPLRGPRPQTAGRGCPEAAASGRQPRLPAPAAPRSGLLRLES